MEPKTVIAFGWCGAVHPDVRVGDILLASSVIREEGTSYHYLSADADPLPSPTVNSALRGAAARAGVPLREGLVWTTDAPYRETRSKVSDFGDRGVLGVDMETSAIVSLGSALGIGRRRIAARFGRAVGQRVEMGRADPRIRRGAPQLRSHSRGRGAGACPRPAVVTR